MIEVEKLLQILERNSIKYFTGVPDSVLKETDYYLNKKKKDKHFIATNEGSAVALAIGYNLATKKIPCVYMQNSGLENALNPLISVAHKKVYSIPMVLLIGWRGAPGKKDEPQHKLKGAITEKLLQLLNIKYCVLNNKNDLKKIKELIVYAKKNNNPVALLIKKDTLKNSKKKKLIKHNITLKREDVISDLLRKVKKNSKIIATTGFTSRELHQIRKIKKEKKGNDFYMVGGMGHTSMVSLGISIKTLDDVICLDGDGSFLMHLGSLVSIGKIGGKNFKHILFNNNSHESVGGQTTNIEKLNIKKLILSSGYKNYYLIKSFDKISITINKFLKSKGPSFLEIKIGIGSIKDLKRPKNLLQIKKNFIKSF